jgi:hypothetical protein
LNFEREQKWDSSCEGLMNTTHIERIYFIDFAIASHSLAQFRHDLAHAAICLSSGNDSQAAAQSLQHLVQHSQPWAQSSLCRAHKDAHILQHWAQSMHMFMHLACSFFPSPTSLAQWMEHASHCTWHSAQMVAHLSECAPCGWSAARVAVPRLTTDASNTKAMIAGVFIVLVFIFFVWPDLG